MHLTGITVTGGFAPQGGGIDQTAGKLVLNRVRVTGNQAAGDVLVKGGGIFSGGTLSLIGSTVTGNQAFAGDAGQVQALGGGIAATGALVITKSTVIAERRHRPLVRRQRRRWRRGRVRGGDVPEGHVVAHRRQPWTTILASQTASG